MHGIREGLIIGLLAFGAYLLLALGTYSVGDPGWSSTGNGAAISNSGGAAGAWIADCLLYTSPSPRDRTRSRMPSSA